MAPRAALLAALSAVAAAQRTTYSLNAAWRFELNGAPGSCADPNTTFPIDLSGQQCLGLSQVAYSADVGSCIDACCGDANCGIWQFCPAGATGCAPALSCWIGNGTCQKASGWVSRGRVVTPTPTPGPGAACSDPRCAPGTDDSSWRTVSVPHDFIVEGNFSKSATESAGYLPYGVGWYRKHFSLAAAMNSPGASFYIDVDGVGSTSTVWLNGALLGEHTGFTPVRYWLSSSALVFGGGDNLLAVKADATAPDGWWYIAGGITRNVWLVVVQTPGPFLTPWGIYAASNVTGPITWRADGTPVADAQLTPSVEVASNATAGSAAQAFAVSLTVLDASGATVAATSGSGSVAAGTSVTWAPAPGALPLPQAALWHTVSLPTKPALYTLVTSLSVGGVPVDAINVTFGVRTTRWDPNMGFLLNGMPVKIKGNANHEDFAAVGGGVPDHLQWHRVAKLQEFGSNGWRTAHNAPAPSLLDATDELGMLVWDENHRNGQLSEAATLILRDRNHPSVVIWSICNEVLCNTATDWVKEALAVKEVMHTLDPLSGRPVSANQNGWLGPNTPLDVQGVDYSTTSYDSVHSKAPGIPIISSETSSAVSDRGEYVNNATSGHVSGYDNNFPGWGQTAEGAWGGIGEADGQGILTRQFVSGGWTWTGWDYRGEPTPYAWPNVNSHFGIIDLAGFPKDRYYWYQAHFIDRPADSALVYAFPSTWNWPAGSNVDVWVYSDADTVELLLNGASQGSQAMTRYAHATWNVPYAPGSLVAVGYKNGSSTPVGNWTITTAGAPAQLVLSIKDGVGAQLVAGCAAPDTALLAVALVDAAGVLVPNADVDVTFTVTAGPGVIRGTSNGDPSCLVNNLSPTRPTFHGLAMSVLSVVGAAPGSITVTATAPGLPASNSVVLQVVTPQQAWGSGRPAAWCFTGPQL